MRKGQVPQPSAQSQFPNSKKRPAALKDTTPKQQPYFFAADGELHLPQPESAKVQARAA